MARIGHSAASRNRGAARLLRWSILALAGIGGGMILGEMVVGGRAKNLQEEPPSYSRLSANPDALLPQGETAPPCLDCADSYGVAARLRAHRDRRMSGELRELGAVDADPSAPIEADDDYRYGGRFPDPEPPDRGATAPPAEPLPAATPANGIPPIGETPLRAQDDRRVSVAE